MLVCVMCGVCIHVSWIRSDRRLNGEHTGIHVLTFVIALVPRGYGGHGNLGQNNRLSYWFVTE